MVPQWSFCDDVTLYNYAVYLDNLLQDIVIPYHALFDKYRQSFLPLIDKFYNGIVKCISTAIADVIPKRKRPISSFMSRAGIQKSIRMISDERWEMRYEG